MNTRAMFFFHTPLIDTKNIGNSRRQFAQSYSLFDWFGLYFYCYLLTLFGLLTAMCLLHVQYTQKYKHGQKIGVTVLIFLIIEQALSFNEAKLVLSFVSDYPQLGIETVSSVVRTLQVLH